MFYVLGSLKVRSDCGLDGLDSLTLLSKDLCPTVNWTKGLGSLVTFSPDCRAKKKKKLKTIVLKQKDAANETLVINYLYL